MAGRIEMGYSLDFRKRVLTYKDKHSLTFERTSAHLLTDTKLKSLKLPL
ncbi:hypothetical protein XIS1_480128 [Xenorhabdus innexi]|uniref:Uncharacterized protein n=1 Tax=Xenorhabdus innexi TaxID=290109 RepID=A0A1N6MYW7_9GAMM|nr:hypothetical protein XIS1_480128 [Xenorhabdus innexi]